MKRERFKVIGFDADDTLWDNEIYFRETEREFSTLLKPFSAEDKALEELFRTETANLQVYGYGIKSFMLSMIETALRISGGMVAQKTIEDIVELGKEQILKPLVLLEGVVETLERLYRQGQRMIVATKGDLLDQERKLRNSGIDRYFHHIEIMSEKKAENYRKLLTHLDIDGAEFLMVGNSVKSDILPVLELGGSAVHIPFHTTWQHELVENIPESDRFVTIDRIGLLSDILNM